MKNNVRIGKNAGGADTYVQSRRKGMDEVGSGCRILDPVVVVVKALFAGLRVKIAGYEFYYDPNDEEVFIVSKRSSGEEAFLRTDTISLNSFIKMIHAGLSDIERVNLVYRLAIRKQTGRRRSKVEVL